MNTQTEINSIINTVKLYDPHVNSNQITKAYEFSKNAHEGQGRSSGKPYFTHCVS